MESALEQNEIRFHYGLKFFFFFNPLRTWVRRKQPIILNRQCAGAMRAREEPDGRSPSVGEDWIWRHRVRCQAGLNLAISSDYADCWKIYLPTAMVRGPSSRPSLHVNNHNVLLLKHNKCHHVGYWELLIFFSGVLADDAPLVLNGNGLTRWC